MAFRQTAQKLEQSKDSQVNDLQTSIREATKLAVESPFVNGRLIKTELDANGLVLQGLTFAAGVPKIIEHGLGRPYLGFMVLRQRFVSYATPFEMAQDAALNDRQITMISAVLGTVDLWVY